MEPRKGVALCAAAAIAIVAVLAAPGANLDVAAFSHSHGASSGSEMSHAGRLDARGCHWGPAGYHCHR